MTASSSSKQALVLSSIGANGAYGVGVIKALFSGKSPATNFQPLDPEVFLGRGTDPWFVGHASDR